MKATGIVRPVDPLGRVVIPVELRRNLGIKTEEMCIRDRRYPELLGVKSA